MSVAEVTGRIQQIQAQLAQFTNLAGPARAAGGTAFANALGAAQVAAEAAAEGDATGSAVTTAAPAGAPATAATRSTGPASVAGGGSVAGQAVVEEARKYLGVPYVWGGTDPSKGLDCSGLVQLVYRKLGIELPRVSYQQATAGRPVANLDQARPGDILAFNSPVNHVGIYIGNGKMIEAPRSGKDVRVIDVYEKPTAIRRVLPETPAATATTRVASAGSVSGSSSLPAGTPYANLFERAGAKYGVSPTLLAAVAKQESGFNPRAVSHAGAQGLMQLMPGTASGLGVRNPFDPAQAVDGAARLLKSLTAEFGRVDLALAAYNAGPGAVKRYDGIPPYAETRKYVPAVLAHQAALERS